MSCCMLYFQAPFTANSIVTLPILLGTNFGGYIENPLKHFDRVQVVPNEFKPFWVTCPLCTFAYMNIRFGL